MSTLEALLSGGHLSNLEALLIGTAVMVLPIVVTLIIASIVHWFVHR